MLLLTAKQLSYRAARTWTKCQSSSGPYVYTVSDREVVTNRPHIVLTKFQQQRPNGGMGGLASMFGFQLPPPEEEEDYEMEGSGKDSR